ncbi:MAG: acetyl-CoA carboxylase biotin carboxyl carrier protein [Planctomycetota bacterium]|jgi:acetyl-CoA carboxylase biotin carboxyl carrier protein|nr:acetyl-CoA carboxylase biotin carboxyl carrier protein [Planctomycetota bacterium]
MSDSIDKIKDLLALMRDNDLVELELREGEFRVALRRQTTIAAPAFPPPPVIAPAAAPAAPAAGGLDATDLEPIKSPIVGTIYRGPTPDASPFVNEGDAVEKNTVVCIIEAMKIMNEIKAGVDGRIERVLVESGEPVEYGQPLFLVRRD